MTSPADEVRVFAPATVANLGPGFDVLGLALDGPGDSVAARRSEPAGVRILKIEGDGGALPLEAARNTAGIAAAEVLRRGGATFGVELELTKGMPLGSGLGSSAASAAAGAVAANRLLDSPLDDNTLIECCVEAEASVSGRHADNVAPAVLGGLVLVRSVAPLDVVRLPVPDGLTVTVVTPEYEVPTKKAREVLPREIGLEVAVANAANLAALVAAFHSGDLALIGRSLDDRVVTPARAALIPGCREVLAGALEAGALGASISGAGPSVFALCDSPAAAETVAAAMRMAFTAAGLASSHVVSAMDCPGARSL